MSATTPLHCASPTAWVDCVTERFDQFLLDHAAAEKKAAGMALSMLSHYPDRARLVTAMSELAAEELVHFREVVKLIQERGLQLSADGPGNICGLQRGRGLCIPPARSRAPRKRL